MKKTRITLMVCFAGILTFLLGCSGNPPEKTLPDDVKLAKEFFGADYE